MSSFGVKTVGFDVIKLSRSEEPVDVQLKDHFDYIRRLKNSEGRVVYFLDNNNNVIGLLKKKSCWYIIVRAIREKCKFYSNSSKLLFNF